MNFALLGDDPVVLPMLQSIAAAEEHWLTHVVSPGSISQEVLHLAASSRVLAAWDELLGVHVDAVILSGHRQELLTAARHLASDGRALVVYPRAGQGSEWVYELTLVEQGDSLLLPLFAHRAHPAMQALCNLVGGGQLGRLLHLQLEREQPVERDAGRRSDGPVGGHRAKAPPPLLRSDVDEALLHDVDLLRLVGGDYNQVTALVSAASGEGVSLATVTLAGESLPEAIWTIKPTAGEPRWQLRVTGETGTAVLSGGGELAQMQLFSDGSTSPESAPHAGFDEGIALLAQVEAAVAGRPTTAAKWSDLVRAFDTVDGMHRSLRRRRTIDLQFETTSERSQFKTQMTAVGCGILMVTVLAVVLLLVASAVLDPRGTTEIAAEAANSILYREEFAAGSPELTRAGSQHVAQIAVRIKNLPSQPFPVLIEQPAAAEAELAERRRQHVADRLRELEVLDGERRTVVAPVEGRAFSAVMRVARIAVCVPLMLFLVLQLLLFIARPAQRDPQSNEIEPGEAA